MPPRRPPLLRCCGQFLATWLAYVLAGKAGLLLTIPPGMASPLYPAAGVALAASAVWGWPAMLAAGFGGLCVNLTLPHSSPMVAVGIGIGAGLQAAAGAWLLRRALRGPLELSEPRDLLRFYGLGGLLGCVVSASVALIVLAAGRQVAPADFAAVWLTWWTGDLLGVLIGAPIALTVIGQPRADWSSRRLTVGLPLLVVTLLMGLGIRQIARLEQERQQQAFEREAAVASNAVVSRLHGPLRALEAARGLFAAQPTVSREAFRRGTEGWLTPEFGLQAIGWIPRVPKGEIGAVEAAAQADGHGSYRVVDHAMPMAAVTTSDAAAAPILFIEPLAQNEAALGTNSLSTPASREALLSAARSGRPVATAGFELAQGGSGVVVYQAIQRPDAPTTAEPAGWVFVTVRLEGLLPTAGQDVLPTHLAICISDRDAGVRNRVLAGGASCDALSPGQSQQTRPLDFAGRHWDVRVYGRGPLTLGAVAWPSSVIGLLATAMLGALLLTVTGRARRIERAVASRTADLQREVGERKRTEAALRESEQRFRNILDHVPIGVIYTDLTGRIEQANPKLRAMLGYSEAELSSMHTRDLLQFEEARAEQVLTERLIAGEVSMYRHRRRVLCKNGQTAWVAAVTTVLRDEKGRPARLVGVMEDITEPLRLEEAERARERAEAANRAKSEFLSRMSHELRTPLNAMLGFAQLLELDRQQPLAPYQTEWTAQIQQAGWHLLHMINDTLDLSRIESGTLRLQPQPLDLPELLRATRSLLEQAADRRQVRMLEQFDAEALRVDGDPTRVKQILTNLLSNAIKYNVEGGRVMVTTRLHDPMTVQIEVSDTGYGMTEQQLEELFQPFNRLGREASGAEGTGIGLVISQRLAELMGGSLSARSEAGVGSTFVLLLPRAGEPGRAAAPSEHDQLQPAIYHQRLVHYVEDNETNAEVMRGILAQRPQVALEVSATGLDGLAGIRQRRPSLVLLDMHLPDIDGLELLRHLKHDDLTADIPVVVVSADATAASIHEALNSGAAQYLTKPVNVAEILGVLDDLLERMETRFGM